MYLYNYIELNTEYYSFDAYSKFYYFDSIYVYK